jgi:hypothetical protein
MTTSNPAPTIGPPAHPGPLSGVDVALIMVAGIGLLFGGSLVIGLRMELSLLTSLLLYTLNFVSLAGSVMVLGVLRRRVTWAELGLRGVHWAWFVAAVGVVVVFLPLRAAIGLAIVYLLHLPLESLQARAELLAADLSWLAFFSTLLMAGLLIPFAEELFFRGVLFGWLRRRYGLWAGIIASALIFAVAHADLAVGASNLILGFVLAWMYDRSRSLWTCVAVHAVNNAIAVILLFAALALQKLLPGLG